MWTYSGKVNNREQRRVIEIGEELLRSFRRFVEERGPLPQGDYYDSGYRNGIEDMMDKIKLGGFREE